METGALRRIPWQPEPTFNKKQIFISASLILVQPSISPIRYNSSELFPMRQNQTKLINVTQEYCCLCSAYALNGNFLSKVWKACVLGVNGTPPGPAVCGCISHVLTSVGESLDAYSSPSSSSSCVLSCFVGIMLKIDHPRFIT